MCKLPFVHEAGFLTTSGRVFPHLWFTVSHRRLRLRGPSSPEVEPVMVSLRNFTFLLIKKFYCVYGVSDLRPPSSSSGARLMLEEDARETTVHEDCRPHYLVVFEVSVTPCFHAPEYISYVLAVRHMPFCKGQSGGGVHICL